LAAPMAIELVAVTVGGTAYLYLEENCPPFA